MGYVAKHGVKDPQQQLQLFDFHRLYPRAKQAARRFIIFAQQAHEKDFLGRLILDSKQIFVDCFATIKNQKSFHAFVLSSVLEMYKKV
ncbi:hypothetical protein AGMMS50233_09020 [Endomicrobiia bacterium]|nr:hypothetical protein AGMMS50233_09020 [Endomicrobiia bacterium]